MEKEETNKASTSRTSTQAEEFCRTRCIVCWKRLGLKQHLVHGRSSHKQDLKSKLKIILNTNDFSALYNNGNAWKPRLCKPCFLLILKIPANILRLQTLVGGQINTNVCGERHGNAHGTSDNSTANKNGSENMHGMHRAEDIDFKHCQSLGRDVSLPQGNDPDLLDRLKDPGKYVSISRSLRKERDCSKQNNECPQKKSSLHKVNNKNGKSKLRNQTLESSAISRDGNMFVDDKQNKRNHIIAPSNTETLSKGSTNLDNMVVETFSQREIFRAEGDRSVCSISWENIGRFKYTEKNHERGNCDISVAPSEDRVSLGEEEYFSCEEAGRILGSSSNEIHEEMTDSKTLTALSGREFSNEDGLRESNNKRQDALKRSRKLVNGLKDDNQTRKISKKKSRTEQSKEEYFSGCDDTEECMCTHCGMVLLKKQLLKHCKDHHSNKMKDVDCQSNQTGLFQCRFIRCVEQFSSQEDRCKHVLSHKEHRRYKCDVEDCDQSFYLASSLDNHLWNHCRKPVTCPMKDCGLLCQDLFELAKHSRVHLDGRMQCNWRNCGMLFTAVGTLKQHLISHSRSLSAKFGSDFVCSLCDRVFTTKHALSKHSALHDSHNTGDKLDSGFECEEHGCCKRFTSERDFNNHLLDHFTTHEAVCTVEGCQQMFDSELSLVKHRKLHHLNEKYQCPWEGCQSNFVNFHFLKRHLLGHYLSRADIATDRRHKCSKCDMNYKLEKNLMSHLKNHPEKSKSMCPECGKEFHPNHLKRHRLTHQEEKAHSCDQCGVRYATTNGLGFHQLQVHNIGQWPYKCEFCDKGFISRSELCRHLPSHTKEKSFPCPICGLRFATCSGLKGHLRKHTGERFPCDVSGCDKVFTSPLTLRGHQLQHEGFCKTCEHCGKTFNNPYTHKCRAGREARKKKKKWAGSIQLQFE